MCPKCKSRERVPFPAHVIHEGGYVRRYLLFFKARIKVIRCATTFYCSGCGYELGRWG